MTGAAYRTLYREIQHLLTKSCFSDWETEHPGVSTASRSHTCVRIRVKRSPDITKRVSSTGIEVLTR